VRPRLAACLLCLVLLFGCVQSAFYQPDRVLYDTPAITSAIYRILLTPAAAGAFALAVVATLRTLYGDHPLLWQSGAWLLGMSFLVSLPFAGAMRRRSLAARSAGAAATSSLEEGLANVLAVQGLGAESHARGRFDRAYLNGALLSLLLGEASAQRPGRSWPQPSFNITLLSENAARPGTRSTLTLHGVKIEQWSLSVPEDDFVMEGATFQALYATVADEQG